MLCRRWFTRNIVLIGDAAHTAHFSIGSGTKLAMEDAVALSREIARGGDVSGALQRYQEERELEALKLQSAARNRMEWFENVARYAHLEPLQFTYSLLTGSQRIGHDNLKLRDAAFVGDIERSLAQRCGVADRSCPPMFLPFKLRDLELPNRVVVSPMAQYSRDRRSPERLASRPLRVTRDRRRRARGQRNDVRVGARANLHRLHRFVERNAA